MFFKHKNHEDSCSRLEEQLSALAQDTAEAKQKLELLYDLNQSFHTFKDDTARTVSRLEHCLQQDLGQLADYMSQNLGQLEGRMSQNLGQLEGHFRQLQTDVHKHDMALEDLLDEWAEKKSEEDSIHALVQESSQSEKLLLELFEAYQEQFWNLKHYVSSKDESWAAQIHLMEKTLEHCRRSCAISLIQECGVSVDYDLHEVIEAVDTTDPALDKTIAEIYRCGYLYKGKVRKKAQAAAYRLANAVP